MTVNKTKIRKAAKARRDMRKVIEAFRATLISHYNACIPHALATPTNGAYVIGNDSGEVIYRGMLTRDDSKAYLAPIQPKASYLKLTSLEQAKDRLERIKLANADNPVVAECRVHDEAMAFKLRIETLEDLIVAFGDDDAE